MSEKKSNNKALYIIFLALLGILSSGLFYFYRQAQKKYEPVERVLNDYAQLEQAYMKTVEELEEASSSDYDNIGILKQNLKNILDEIKEQKQIIDANRKKPDEIIIDTSRTKDFYDKLEISKQVADQILVAKLEEVEKRQKELKESNLALKKQNLALEKNLKKMKDYYEEQKAKNESLNSTVESINEELARLEKKGNSNIQELEKMKQKRDEYQKELEISNKTIEAQNTQINQFIETMKKVNLNCYFIFKEGSPEKEATIFLTSRGISKHYLKYFNKEKPNIHVDFSLNKDLFKDGVQKVDLIIFNAENVEIYGTSKSISKGQHKILISSKIFKQGTYSMRLRNGNEDLVIGDEYVFKI